jgi:hypothetical protein
MREEEVVVWLMGVRNGRYLPGGRVGLLISAVQGCAGVEFTTETRISAGFSLALAATLLRLRALPSQPAGKA